MAPLKTVPLSPDLAQMLAGHRKKFKEQDWALAWYLAAECCARFHASHGLAFEPIAHSGLGYYGIAVRPLACKANGHSNQPILGRFTICGDAENWVPGGPGSDRLCLSGMLKEGEISPEEALPAAIRHLRLPLIPSENHYRCRHKARGASYVLLFRLSAMLALHLPMGEVSCGTTGRRSTVSPGNATPMSKKKNTRACFSSASAVTKTWLSRATGASCGPATPRRPCGSATWPGSPKSPSPAGCWTR